MSSFSLQVEPIPPFRLDLTAWALRRRSQNMMDRWDGKTYRRVLVLGDSPLAVAISQKQSADAPILEVHVQGQAASPRIKQEVRKSVISLLGTDLDLTPFYRMAGRNKKLKLLAERFRGLKPPRFPTVFEALANGIACQQLSLSVGILILNRLAAAYGMAFNHPDHVERAFPRAADLSLVKPEALRALGFSYAKARALLDLARSVNSKEINLEGLAQLDDNRALQSLLNLKGVGRWTAEYVLLRGLGRLAIFPGDDVGARKRLRDWLGLSHDLDYQEVNQIISRWKPYAGLVYFHLLLSGLAERGIVAA